MNVSFVTIPYRVEAQSFYYKSCSLHIWLISSVQLLSHVRLFATPWTASQQASLSITNSQSVVKPMSIESVMSSNHLILCFFLLLLPLILPSNRVFSNESVLCIRCQSTGVLASASVLPMNIQDWFPLGWADLISLQSKGLSKVFSNTTVQKYQFFTPGGQSIGVSASALVLPMNIQDRFPLG